jgi:hypothetical protein
VKKTYVSVMGIVFEQKAILRRDELSAKMNESNFKTLLFGSVCGIIGAYQGLVAPDTTTSVITGFAGFAGAVYSALEIEKAEDVFDQSGMKYLALILFKLKNPSNPII